MSGIFPAELAQKIRALRKCGVALERRLRIAREDPGVLGDLGAPVAALAA